MDDGEGKSLSPGAQQQQDARQGRGSNLPKRAASALKPRFSRHRSANVNFLRQPEPKGSKVVDSNSPRPSSLGSLSLNNSRRPSVEQLSVPCDPRCPLSMPPGDMPPLLKFEGEPPPLPPTVDKPDPAAAGLSRPTVIECKSACTPRSSAPPSETPQEVYNIKHSQKRRLSLSVDACRTSKKLDRKPKKTIFEMTATDFLHSTRFDNFVGALILLNALTIGIQTDYAAKHITEEFPNVFQIIERVFLACFTLELSLKIHVQKLKFFCDSKTFIWNYFDLGVVGAQMVEEILTLITVNSSVKADQFRILRILRILRIVRILRVVRVLHLISELRTIVSSILGSFKSLGWTVVLLLLMIYIVSIYFTQTITDHHVSLKTAGVAHGANDVSLRYFFGSLFRTVLSLWQAMSGGADWDAMAGPLIDEVGPVTGVLFAGYIAFALLALMNVVTGVFVQTALQSAKDEEDTFLVDQVVKLFNNTRNSADIATITLNEIKQRLNDPAVAAEWKSINVQPQEAEYLFNLLDIEQAGEISFQEFLSGCLRLHGPSKSMDVLTVMQEARSAMRTWRMTSEKWTEVFQTHSDKMDQVLTHVAECATHVARLCQSVDFAAALQSRTQDRIGHIEKRIRGFEGSLSSVRIATSNLNRANEFIDTVLNPANDFIDSLIYRPAPLPADGAQAGEDEV